MEIKEALKNKIILVGDIKFGTSSTSIPISPELHILNGDKFLQELQNLLIKYKIAKVDVSFDIFQLMKD